MITTMQADITYAMKRTTAKQALKVVRAALLKILKAKGATRSQLRVAAEFLDTDVGLGILSLTIGFVLQQFSEFNTTTSKKLILEQLRITGFQLMFDSVAESFLEPLRVAFAAVELAAPTA